MPNHVTNELRFHHCTEDRFHEILMDIQSDEAGLGSIDFRKLIPEPEGLYMMRTTARYGWNLTDSKIMIQTHLKKQQPTSVLGASITVVPGMTTMDMYNALAMMPWSPPITTRKV